MTQDLLTPKERDEYEVLSAINSGGELRQIHDGLFEILVVKRVTSGATVAGLKEKGYLGQGHADKLAVTRSGLTHLSETASLVNRSLKEDGTEDKLAGN